MLTGTESLDSKCSGECVVRKELQNKEFSSSSENENESTIPGRKTRKSQRREILIGNNLPTSKNKSKKKEIKKRQRKESPNNSKMTASKKHLKK